MKRLIVIILVILLVAGGGAGGLMMMGIIPNPFNPTPQGHLTDAEKAAQELKAKKFQGPTAAFNLIKLDDMIIPVIIEGHVTRRVFIIARLMVDKPANESTVEGRVRLYQDAVMRDLVPFFQKYFLENDALSAIVVKERLKMSAKKVYGDMIEDVVLINVFDNENPKPR